MQRSDERSQVSQHALPLLHVWPTYIEDLKAFHGLQWCFMHAWCGGNAEIMQRLCMCNKAFARQLGRFPIDFMVCAGLKDDEENRDSEVLNNECLQTSSRGLIIRPSGSCWAAWVPR